MDLNNFILIFFLIVFGLFFYKYLLLIINKYNPKFLIDDHYTKPQAFHDSPIPAVGGLCIFFSSLFVYFYFLLFKNVFFLEYLSFCTLLFILGLAEDIKINIKPKIRLALMIISLIVLVKFNNFYLDKTGVELLNNWIESSKFFSLFFILFLKIWNYLTCKFINRAKIPCT